MSTGHRFLTDYGKAISAGGDYVIAPPSSGGTFAQRGLAFGTSTVGAGTYILPDNGLPMYVRATGAVTITSAAPVTVATLASGQAALCIPLTSTTWAATIFDTGSSASLEELETSLTTSLGVIPIPLTAWREVVSNDVAALGTAGTTGSGGVLATDTTPTLEYVNGDTDSSLRVLWAASNNDPLVTQVMLPFDCDVTQPLLFKANGIMSGATDAPVLSLDTYFRDGSGTVTSKIEDDTAAFSDAADTVVATIAAADIPVVASGIPVFITVEITPGAHTTNTLALFGTYLQYTKKLLTS